MEHLLLLQILNKLKKIEGQITFIENKLNSQEPAIKKMEEHINFIDNTYNVVKKPITKILQIYDSDLKLLTKK